MINSQILHWLKNLTIVVVCLPSLFPTDVSAQSLTDSTIYKMVNHAVSDVAEPHLPLEVELLREIIVNQEVTTKAKGLVARFSADKLFSWITDKALDDFSKSLASIESRAQKLDPTKFEDQEKLKEMEGVVRVVNSSLSEIQSAMGQHVNELLVADSVRTFSSYGPIANFWIRTLPQMRRDVFRTRSTIKRIIRKGEVKKKKDEKRDAESSETQNDTETLRWASKQMDRFVVLGANKDWSNQEEAKGMQKWVKQVLASLPGQDKRDKFQEDIASKYSALSNVLVNYIKD